MDSPMWKTGVVRSWWWLLGHRVENRAEWMGMGMGCRRTTTGVSGRLAHSRIVFTCAINGGYVKTGCVGCVGGPRKVDVGFLAGRAAVGRKNIVWSQFFLHSGHPIGLLLWPKGHIHHHCHSAPASQPWSRHLACPLPPSYPICSSSPSISALPRIVQGPCLRV